MHKKVDSHSSVVRHGNHSHGSAVALNDREFEYLRNLIFRIAGISLSPAKKQLVAGRLAKRLNHYRYSSYRDYVELITSPSGNEELQMVVDLLTTNETHFFREPKHFEFLRNRVIPSRKSGQGLRIWSAACSSGEEPYSIAMMLDELLGNEPWEVVASDISSQVLERARKGVYPADRISEIPKNYLNRYCLKGVGEYHGTMMVDRYLRDRINFISHNLTEIPPSDIGHFEVIFLRNVMIYFNQETKRNVVSKLLPLLRPGGYFLVGHSESLGSVSNDIVQVVPAVYQKPL